MRVLFDNDKMIRTVRRITHEILERNTDLQDLVLIGILKNGVPMANMIQTNIENFEGVTVPVYELDISGYRDDLEIESFEKLDVNLSSKTVIVVDDVLFTGRTVRACMDAVIDLGRPSKIQLAVLVDRGHRELPIRADYVGKNVPTNINERIDVKFGEGIYIYNNEES
jgi:pyrimidine operon attenuation protein/uracil phosphoribosyltransferase